jgi:hypothetical protein
MKLYESTLTLRGPLSYRPTTESSPYVILFRISQNGSTTRPPPAMTALRYREGTKPTFSRAHYQSIRQ